MADGTFTTFPVPYKRARVADIQYTPAVGGVSQTLADALARGDRWVESLVPAGTTDHTAYFQAAIDAGGVWFVGPGPFTFTSQVDIKASVTLVGFGTVINHATTTAKTFSAVDVNDWSVLGRWRIVGSGNSAGTAVGFYREGGKRFNVEGVTARIISGRGFYEAPGTFTGNRADVGIWTNCRAENCYIGREDAAGTGAEYGIWNSFVVTGCTQAMLTRAGNITYNACNFEGNTNGVQVLDGTNHAHGKFIGCSFNHNGSATDGWNLRATDVVNGQTFIGCSFFGDANDQGYVWLERCSRIKFVGGVLGAPTKADSLVGYCSLREMDVSGTFALRTAGNSQKKVFYRDLTDANGMWSGNDPGSLYVRATRTTSVAITSGVASDLVFVSENYDTRDSFEPTTGVFTMPWLGNFRFSGSLRFTASLGLVNGFVQVVQGGATTFKIPVVMISATEALCAFDVVLGGAAGSTIKFQATLGGTTVQFADGSQLVVQEVA